SPHPESVPRGDNRPSTDRGDPSTAKNPPRSEWSENFVDNPARRQHGRTFSSDDASCSAHVQRDSAPRSRDARAPPFDLGSAPAITPADNTRRFGDRLSEPFADFPGGDARHRG